MKSIFALLASVLVLSLGLPATASAQAAQPSFTAAVVECWENTSARGAVLGVTATGLPPNVVVATLATFSEGALGDDFYLRGFPGEPRTMTDANGNYGLTLAAMDRWLPATVHVWYYQPSLGDMITDVGFGLSFDPAGVITHADPASWSRSPDFSAVVPYVCPGTVLPTATEAVEAAIANGTLTEQEAHPIQVKIGAAAAAESRGNVDAAVNQHNAALNHVYALFNSGRLTQAEAQPVIDAIEAEIERITSIRR